MLNKWAVIAFLTGRGDYVHAKERIINSTGNKNVKLKGKVAIIKESNAYEAYRVSRLPGVKLSAYGFTSDEKSFLREVLDLASKFLKQKKKFRVLADTEGESEMIDLKMSVEGSILSNLRDKSIDERKPDVTFIISKAGDDYAFGVKLYDGVGGRIQSENDEVTCLVSGGIHSSVVSWLSCLAGKKVRMVHSFVSTFSLYSVAKLYEVLSSRSDPTLLELVVLKGDGEPQDILCTWLSENKKDVYSGYHVECSPDIILDNVSAPAYILPEEKYALYFKELKLRVFKAKLAKGKISNSKYRQLRFGGKRANMHEVIDNLSSS
jgi:hypothetical protein